MSATTLLDWSPLWGLMRLGALLALLPLAWVGWRQRHANWAQRQQALTWLTLFLTFDLVLFGAFTRLTDSGLGCPDWPGCYGQAHPEAAHAAIQAAQTAMPTGPVTHTKAWVEMTHRYLATSVGVLILLLTVLSWALHRRAQVRGAGHLPHPRWPTLTLVWVCLQGAFGALTVTMKLFPLIVTLHLLGGLVLLALLRVQAASPAQTVALAPRWRCALVGVTALVVLQIALGAWVSTNYAVLACNDFPQCQGHWWPPMDGAGFVLWRSLGQTAQGASLSLPALTAIHYAHRLMAYGVLLAVLVLAWRLRQAGLLRGTARALGLLALWQLLTGLANVLLAWPLWGAVAHTGGAAGWVLVLTGALHTSWPRRAHASTGF
jgi:cytochrome c oxidase assembly protein subunit 15